MGTTGRLSVLERQLFDFLFAFMRTRSLLKKGSLLKVKLCSRESKLFLFIKDPFSKRGKLSSDGFFSQISVPVTPNRLIKQKSVNRHVLLNTSPPHPTHRPTPNPRPQPPPSPQKITWGQANRQCDKNNHTNILLQIYLPVQNRREIEASQFLQYQAFLHVRSCCPHPLSPQLLRLKSIKFKESHNV